MGELGRVFANEWMKLMRRKRFILTSLLGAMVVALFGLIAAHEHQNEMQYNSSPAAQISMTQQTIARLRAMPQTDDTKIRIQEMEQQITQLKQQAQQEQAMLTGDWKASVQDQITQLKHQITQIQQLPQGGAGQVSFDQARLMELQYDLDHNLRPLPSRMARTAYINVSEFMDIAARVFLPLLVVVLVADMVSGEATDGTIKLLLVRPVSRAKILFGKWLVSLVASAILTLAICAALLCVSVAVHGSSGALQPQIVGINYTLEIPPASLMDSGPVHPIPVAHYDHAFIVPEWEYLVVGFLLTTLAMMSFATISFLCSTLFRSAMASTAVALGVVISGFIISTIAMQSKWIVALFSVHLNLLANWSGRLASMTGVSVSLWTGIAVLCAWGLASLLISLIYFTRKDVLNA